jgi:hypothetical protein
MKSDGVEWRIVGWYLGLKCQGVLKACVGVLKGNMIGKGVIVGW